MAKDFLNDEGRDGDKVARDGIFSRYCPIGEPGEYKLSIVAKGPTFERTQQVPFRVRPPLLTFSILPGGKHEHSHNEESHQGAPSDHQDDQDDSKKAIQGDQKYIFRVDLSKEAVSFRDLDISVEALSRDRRKTVVHLKRHSSDEGAYYEGTAASLTAAGVYTLKATLKGISKKGQEVEAESAPTRFELTGVMSKPDPTATPVVEEVHHETKEAETFPILPLALISGSSLLAMIVGVFLTKKSKARSLASNQYNPPKQMLDAIASLEQKLVSPDIKVGEVQLESEREAESAEPVASSEPSVEGEPVEQEAATKPTETPAAEEV